MQAPHLAPACIKSTREQHMRRICSSLRTARVVCSPTGCAFAKKVSWLVVRVEVGNVVGPCACSDMRCVGQKLSLPYKAAHCPACSSYESRGSVNSFAYQGTNSHVVMGIACPVTCTNAHPWIWQRAHLWYQVTSHPLMLSFTPGGPGAAITSGAALADMCYVECSLQQPALAFMLQCSVLDKRVAPSALLLEMVAAAGQLLLTQKLTINQLAVANYVAHAPLMLLHTGAQVVLTCGIHQRTATAMLSSRVAQALAVPPQHAQAHLHTTPAPIKQQAVPRRPYGSLPIGQLKWWHYTAAHLKAARYAHCATGALSATPAQQQQLASSWLHPAVAEAALQAADIHLSPGDLLDGAILASCAAYAPSGQPITTKTFIQRAMSHQEASIGVVVNDFQQVVVATRGNRYKVLLTSLLPPSILPSAGPELNRVADNVLPGAGALTFVQELSEIVAHIVGKQYISPDQPLMDAGLDSNGDIALLNGSDTLPGK